LDAPDQPPLHSGRHPVAHLEVEVRILGASHQILARTAEAGGLICRETVACREGAPGPLPTTAERELDDGYHYELRCVVRAIGPEHFPAWVAALRDYAGSLADATVAVFPAVPDAVTAVVVEPLPARLRGVLWRTWHTYPDPAGGGEVVATRTVLHGVPPSGGAEGGMPGLRP
jgi:hypothetical protein